MSWHVPNTMMLAADKFTQFLYAATGGLLGEKQLSYSMLLLHAIGRKSGQKRTHALLYFRDGDDLSLNFPPTPIANAATRACAARSC